MDVEAPRGLLRFFMLGYVRRHWGIENKLHWSLHVSCREDSLRNRVGHSAENLSRIRRLALNLLKRDNSCKAGVKGKRLQVCLKQDYPTRALCQGSRSDCPDSELGPQQRSCPSCILARIAEMTIKNVYDYSHALKILKPGKPMAIEVLRNGEKLELTITPDAR